MSLRDHRRGAKRRRRKGRTKAQNQAAHTYQRSLQRCSVVLTPERQAVIVTKIQNSEGTCIERQSGRVTVWDVEIEGEIVRVVYDAHRKTLATVLPRDRDEQQRTE